MSLKEKTNIIIERVDHKHLNGFTEAIIESRHELFASGFVGNPENAFEETKNWISGGVELWNSDKAYYFCIIDESSNQLVGQTFLNHVERMYQMANLGYWVRTNRAGEGIATEAAKLVAQYGFENLGFQRLEIVTEKDHIASQRIAEKIGAVREGLLRNRLILNGSVHDAYMYSLIPSDFGILKTA